MICSIKNRHLFAGLLAIGLSLTLAAAGSNALGQEESPLQKRPGPQLPADFGLNLYNGVFSTEYLAFTIDLPTDWSVLNAEEIRRAIEKSRSDLAGRLKAKGNFVFSLERTKRLVSVTNNDATFQIIAEQGSVAGFKPLPMLKEIERFSAEKLGAKITKPTHTVLIGGVEFARFDMLDRDHWKGRFYVANRKDIALEIIMAFQNDSDAAAMDAALKTIRFK